MPRARSINFVTIFYKQAFRFFNLVQGFWALNTQEGLFVVLVYEKLAVISRLKAQLRPEFRGNDESPHIIKISVVWCFLHLEFFSSA